VVLDESVIAALKIRVSGVQFPPWPLTVIPVDNLPCNQRRAAKACGRSCLSNSTVERSPRQPDQDPEPASSHAERAGSDAEYSPADRGVSGSDLEHAAFDNEHAPVGVEHTALNAEHAASDAAHAEVAARERGFSDCERAVGGEHAVASGLPHEFGAAHVDVGA
jgi:hypothetical protein